MRGGRAGGRGGGVEDRMVAEDTTSSSCSSCSSMSPRTLSLSLLLSTAEVDTHGRLGAQSGGSVAGAGGGSQAGDCCSGAEAGFVAGAGCGGWSAPVSECGWSSSL